MRICNHAHALVLDYVSLQTILPIGCVAVKLFIPINLPFVSIAIMCGCGYILYYCYSCHLCKLVVSYNLYAWKAGTSLLLFL
jgi:hypothetical protein